MKKLLAMLLLHAFALGVVFAGVTFNPKQGYVGVAWGSAPDAARMAGYKLKLMDKEYTDLLYTEPVEAYKVTPKDKSVTALQFHYYKGQLFFITETLTGYGLDPQKLATRYGGFNKSGIIRSGKQYTDAIFEADGSISSLSITIAANSEGNTITNMYDWNVYKSISVAVQKTAKKTEPAPVKKSIIDELEDMAGKLVQEKAGTSKPTFAFSYLATDYKNVLVENYVTDALTEAMFNTGKIKIIERAYLEEALKEQKFQSSGLVNEETAKSIGMLVGADFICYGTLKDLGDSFTVNARVVNVETGELCAISRATITKDGYLKQRSQRAEGERKTATASTAKTATPAAAAPAPAVAPAPATPATPAASTSAKTTPVANNAWKVSKYNDDFGGAKVYVFTVNSSDEKMLFIRYQKANNPANSKVIAGIHWVDSYWQNKGT